MLKEIRPAIVMIVLFSALTGLAYPLAITGIAQAALKGPADGSLVVKDGRVLGSALIGQNFTADRYFHPRPSATQATDPNDSSKTIDAPYNADNSGGSNLGPTSSKLVDAVKARVAALGGSPSKPVPADAVTTSASGLDPDISPDFAALQVERVAKTRGLPIGEVQGMVRDGTTGPLFGLFGEARVNVLKLNMALDGATPGTGAKKPSAPPTP